MHEDGIGMARTLESEFRDPNAEPTGGRSGFLCLGRWSSLPTVTEHLAWVLRPTRLALRSAARVWRAASGPGVESDERGARTR